jgi:hypothetical protein
MSAVTRQHHHSVVNVYRKCCLQYSLVGLLGFAGTGDSEFKHIHSVNKTTLAEVATQLQLTKG